MRILHVENQAGVAWQLAQAQRRLGHDAVVIETYANPLNLPHDRDFYYAHQSFGKDLSNGIRMVRFAQDFDVVHLHGGIHWKRWDALAIKLFRRRPMVVHYHGSEARDGYGMRYQFLADHKFLSRPDLSRWVPDGEYVPNPVEELPYSFDTSSRPRVVHMVVNRRTKGTDLIVRALDELREEGLDFEPVVLERVDHSMAMDELSRSHVLIDQVLPPSPRLPSIIGLATLEAMSMGKAAISTFDAEYRPFYPGCPVIAIDASAEALKQAVWECISDLEVTRVRGLAGREYVKKDHSADEIVKRIMPVYESLVRK
ncbi:MAG: glycosyltransferase family 4 protein [Methanomassiliicoccus sp.]|nr:glycosyltransferase family 4 protein [Methanomassiliicoccus sp.]